MNDGGAGRVDPSRRISVDAQRTIKAIALVARASPLALAIGCAGWRHGSTLAYYQSAVLDAHTVGAARVKIEAAYDSSVAEYVTRNGFPDYLCVGSGSELEFFYMASDRLVHFHRPLMSSKSVFVERPIPDAFLELIPVERAREIRDARSVSVK